MSTEKIIIEGKTAKRIHRILAEGHSMMWYNDGTAKNPVLWVEEEA